MKLHPANPSPAQEASLARIASNFTGKINLQQPTEAEQEAAENQVDALPEPPTWYRAPLMSDPTQLYESFSTLTTEQIKENVDLLLLRHRKRCYQIELVAAGSTEKLKEIRRQAHEQREQQRQQRCQAAEVDFEPDPFD